jgi:glycosyltransferase involved in cell wall biosynthesis
MTKVSIVIPARNEEANLAMVLGDVQATLRQLPQYEFELVVVDDHSTDRTREVSESFGARVISNPGKNGKGMALRLGFESTDGELIAMLDADYSHRAEELSRFLEQFADESVGLVIGSRVVGGSEEYTHIRALGKVFRRDVFTDFTYTSRMFEIEIEIIANALRKGYRVVEISSHERARAGGEAKSRVVRHGTRFLLRIFYEGIRGVKPVAKRAAAMHGDLARPQAQPVPPPAPGAPVH